MRYDLAIANHTPTNLQLGLTLPLLERLPVALTLLCSHCGPDGHHGSSVERPLIFRLVCISPDSSFLVKTPCDNLYQLRRWKARSEEVGWRRGWMSPGLSVGLWRYLSDATANLGPPQISHSTPDKWINGVIQSYFILVLPSMEERICQ
jgi:hypothetical protein